MGSIKWETMGVLILPPGEGNGRIVEPSDVMIIVVSFCLGDRKGS